jgi:chromosome segregation ATPase
MFGSISKTSTADEVSNSEPQKSDISEEYCIKVPHTDALTATMAEFAAQLAGFQNELATSQRQTETSVSNYRLEMQKELADLRMACQGHEASFQQALLRDIDVESDATGLPMDEMSDGEPHKSDISEDYYSKIRHAQDQMSEQIDALRERIESAPWRIESASSIQSIHEKIIQDLAADVNASTTRVAQFSIDLATSQGQVEASLSGLSNLRQEMQHQLADLRLVSQGHGQTTESTMGLPLNNQLEDIDAKIDATALQLKDRLDGIVSQILDHKTRLDGLTPGVEAVEPKFSDEKVHDWLKDIETKSDATALELNKRLKDIETKSGATALQLNTRLSDIKAKSDAANSQLNKQLRDIEAKSDATAFTVNSCLKDIEAKSGAIPSALNNRLNDIETKSGATALQLNTRKIDIKAGS